MHPGDKNHPAQVEKVTENKIIGEYVKTGWSSMITPARKAKLLDRLEGLIRAFKEARMRANNQEVVRNDIGQIIFDYLHNE